MQVVSAAAFIDWLTGQPDPAIDTRAAGLRVQVDGDVKLGQKTSSIENRQIEGIDFSGILDLGHGRFAAGFRVRNCSARTLILSQAIVEGALAIDGGEFQYIDLGEARIDGSASIQPNQIRPLIAINLGHARIGRSLEIGGRQSEGSSSAGQLEVAASIDLSGIHIHGDLLLRDLEIQHNVELSNARVEGNVLLTQVGGPEQVLTVRGAVVAANIRVEGNFQIQGAEIGTTDSSSPSGSLALDLEGAIIGGNLHLYPKFSPDGIAITGDIRLRGRLDARGIVCREVRLIGAEIDGDVNLDFGSFTALFADVHEASRVRIKGSLRLSSILGRPWIDLRGIVVIGEVRVLGSEINFFKLVPAWISIGAETYENDIVPSSAGRLLLLSTHIYGDLALYFAQIDGTQHDMDMQGLIVRACTIGGELSLWSPVVLQDMWRKKFRPPQPIARQARPGAAPGAWDPDPLADAPSQTQPIAPWRYSAAVVGDVRIENSKIDGSADLSFAKATGVISLENSDIMGELRFCSTQTAAKRLGGTDSGRADVEDALDPLMRASAAKLVMRMLRVDNDVDLTGLSVFADSAYNWVTTGAGTVDGTQLIVKGTIQAYAADDHNAARESYIEVPGKFDLSNVRASQLLISGHSFPLGPELAPPSGGKNENGLILSGASIEEIAIPLIDARPRGRPYPVALDDLTVKSWAIGARNDDDVSPYQHLLEKDAFRRSSYTSMEVYFRNRGEDRHATTIYRDMWWREHRGERGWRRWLLYAYGLIGFGSNLWPLLGVIIVTAVLGYPLYRHPANIEPSLARLAAETSRDSKQAAMHSVSPDPAEWTAADAIWMQFRYQVPIVALGMRDEWAMRDDGNAVYDLTAFSPGPDFIACNPTPPAVTSSTPAPAPKPDCWGHLSTVLWFAAEDAAGILAVMNYLAWPLLIAFALRKLLRTRGSASE